MLGKALMVLMILTGCGKEQPKHSRDRIAIGDYATVVHDFEADSSLEAPWSTGTTGSGEPKWAVETYADAASGDHVLMQSGVAMYPWCIKTDAVYRDGSVEVSFKPIAGTEDMAGGLVWRWKDRDNYYVARANALEDNVAIYRTVGGERQELKSVKTTLRKGEWRRLRVNFKASSFDVYLDDEWVLDEDDATFVEAGAVGVWTKADSVTAFDDLAYGGER